MPRDVHLVTPLADAAHLHAAWMEPHILSMRALTERAARLDRQALLTTPPRQVTLSVCGPLMVPVGGALLLDFERHLRSFNISDAGEADNPLVSSSYGSVHVVSEYSPSNTTALELLGATAVVYRRPRSTSSAQAEPSAMDSPSSLARADSRGSGQGSELASRALAVRASISRCSLYRQAVWTGYMQWILGALELFPRLHLVWLSWESMQLHTLLERLETLDDAVRLVPMTDVADKFIRLFETLALASSLVNFDIKPKDLLVRRIVADPSSSVGVTQWDARLSDLGVVGQQTGLLPSLPPACHLLVNLMQPTSWFACGPLRHHAFAQRFVAAAFNASQRAVHPASLVRFFALHCSSAEAIRSLGLGSSDAHANDHFNNSSWWEWVRAAGGGRDSAAVEGPREQGAGQGPHMLDPRNGLLTGQMSISRATISYNTLSLVSNGGNHGGFGFIHRAYAALARQWVANGTALCHREMTWNVAAGPTRLESTDEGGKALLTCPLTSVPAVGSGAAQNANTSATATVTAKDAAAAGGMPFRAIEVARPFDHCIRGQVVILKGKPVDLLVTGAGFSADINGRYSLRACDPISGHAVYKGGKGSGATLHYMPPKRNPVGGWALDLKGPRYVAPGCSDPTPVACRWCAVTGLGPLPVPSVSVWTKEAEEAASLSQEKLRVSVTGAGYLAANGAYGYVPRRRYWLNKHTCWLKHDSPRLPISAGGWQLACHNAPFYQSPGCHDQVPDTCAGWRVTGAGKLPLPNVSAAPSAEAYAAHLQLLRMVEK